MVELRDKFLDSGNPYIREICRIAEPVPSGGECPVDPRVLVNPSRHDKLGGGIDFESAAPIELLIELLNQER